jgi:hypothetical protein
MKIYDRVVFVVLGTIAHSAWGIGFWAASQSQRYARWRIARTDIKFAEAKSNLASEVKKRIEKYS